MAENTVKDLKDFFSTPERPVTSKEMVEFWRDMPDEEKDYYRKADLS